MRILILFTLIINPLLASYAFDHDAQSINDLKTTIKTTQIKIDTIQENEILLKNKLNIIQQKLAPHDEPILKPLSIPHKESLWEKQTFPYNLALGHNLLNLHADNYQSYLIAQPFITGNADIFSDISGLKINNGTSSQSVIRQNTVIRNWIYQGGINIGGRILENTHFLITPNFDKNQFYISNAKMALTELKHFSVQAGYQASLLSGFYNKLNSYLTYPGFTTNMAPSQENGVVLYGYLGKDELPIYYQNRFLGYFQQFSYQLGIYNGTPDGVFPGLNPISISSSLITYVPSRYFTVNKSFEGRFFINPFLNQEHNFFKHLGFGLAASTQKLSKDTNLPFILTLGQNIMFGYNNFLYPTYAINTRNRIHPELVWYNNNIAFFAEWAQTLQTLTPTNPDTNPSKTPSIIQINKSSEVSLYYNITGEPFSLNGKIEPFEKFNFFQSKGWGALQFFIRFTTFRADPSSFSIYKSTQWDGTYYLITDPRASVSKATGYSLGFNWFWNQLFSLRTEFAGTQFTGGCSTGSYNDPLYPGCLTARPMYIYAPGSQVINRPNEYVAMQSFTFAF
ncbi:MAG: hypothetical protein EBQ95_01345 [Gammaproteobacteria bacterium]|nr:hypothetical protein [Gammaproteobacteria bacterium]